MVAPLLSSSNWNPGAETDPRRLFLSCHSPPPATLPLDDRSSGVLSRTAALEEGARGWGWGWGGSRFLSPQQSIIVVYISAQNSLVMAAEPTDQPRTLILISDCRYEAVASTAANIRAFLKIYAAQNLFSSGSCRSVRPSWEQAGSKDPKIPQFT